MTQSVKKNLEMIRNHLRIIEDEFDRFEKNQDVDTLKNVIEEVYNIKTISYLLLESLHPIFRKFIK